MENARTLVLFLHIAAGFVALTVGLVPFFAKKGGPLHNRTGLIFYYAMLFVAFSSFALATHRFSPFLLMVGLVTLYTTVTGYRGLVLMRRRAARGTVQDWLLLGGCAVGLALAAGQTVATAGTTNVSVIVLVSFFSLALLNFLRIDAPLFAGRRTMTRPAWIRYHIGRISTAYIATFTAFLVNNVHTHPEFIAWLLPTVVGLPVIGYFKRQHGERRRVA